MQLNKALRKTLIQQRQQLPGAVRNIANTQINNRIERLKVFQQAKHIAAYVSNQGEADPMPLMHLAHALGKCCYLPVLHPWFAHKMLFMPWHPQAEMTYNRFAIAEPAYQLKHAIKPSLLDMVLVPLVGFDKQCHRLGMGGGFYDRTFAFRKQRQHWQQPLLIGMAFDEQRVEVLPSNVWDVAMDAVITPNKIYLRKHLYKAS